MFSNTVLKRTIRKCNSYPSIASVAIFIWVFVFFNTIYYFAVGDPMIGDHYFHFKYADLLKLEGLSAVKNFDWISPSGDIGNGSRYAVNLFQISIIPFTYFSNKLIALQILDVFHMSATIALIYYVMRKTRVKYPLFFTLGVLSISYFTMRLLTGRAFVFSLALFFLQMWLATERKWKKLFFTVIFCILWHQNTYFMPLIIVSIIEISRYLVEMKIYWKNIFSVLSATVVGMFFFPGFPHSLVSWMSNIFKIQSTNIKEVGMQTIAGNELASKDFINFFVNKELLIILIIFCSTAVIFIYWTQRKKSKINLNTQINTEQMIWMYGVFIFTIITMLGTLVISGRFFDFFFPAIWFLSAISFSAIIIMDKIIIDKTLAMFLKYSAVIVMFIFIGNVVIDVYARANSFDYMPARKAAQWIHENSDKRERVFLSNWGMFTLMFFENSHNVYTTGIEPMALKSYDESLYWKYYNIFSYGYYCEKQGDCKDEISAISKNLINANENTKKSIEKENGRKIINSIKNDFDSKFIVSDSKKITSAVLLNLDLIEDYVVFESEKFKGQFMKFTVFKLK